MDKEVRFAQIEMREQEDKALLLEGYAVVFDSETYIGDDTCGFFEKVDKKALANTDMKDVPLRYNHNDGFAILARTRNNSLTLSVDDKGLKISARLQPEVQTHQDIYNMVKSGLVDKMSFAFIIEDEDLEVKNGEHHRTITKIKRLYDVSIVDSPAYGQTEVYARSLKEVETKFRSLDSGSQATPDGDKARLALLKAKIKLIAEA